MWFQIENILNPDEWTKEHRFHVERMWRFDFAHLASYVAVEVEGLSRHRSRHTTFQGYRNDCEKYNEAQVYGWCVLRFTGDEIANASAISMIERAIETRLEQWARSKPRTNVRTSGAEPIHASIA